MEYQVVKGIPAIPVHEGDSPAPRTRNLRIRSNRLHGLAS